MERGLTQEETGAITMLLGTGKAIKDIAKFADLDVDAVTMVARELDLEPATEAQRRAKELFASPKGVSYQEVAKQLASEGHAGDDGAPMHHLTVAAWVRNFGWAWGGADDGNYDPDRPGSTAGRSRFLMRLSKSVDAEINTPAGIKTAAAAAWTELESDKTHVVQLAIIRGAASAGVTDLAEVKKALMAAHGDEIRNARV